MRYLGGKDRIASELCSYLESVRKPGQLFTDLTVGGCSIISRMSGRRRGYDVHPQLICLYQALSEGNIILPDFVTAEEYAKARVSSDTTPLIAFIGFGCSFAGKYFGGYASDNKGRNYAKNAKNSLTKKFKTLKGTPFECQSLFDYDSIGELIYIDPPYFGTTKYAVKFDYKMFWDKVRELSKCNDVYVSEYVAPSDFECVLEIPKKLGLRKNIGGQIISIERLWRLK